MADIRLAAVIRYLHRLADPSASAGQSDAVLLGRLATQRDPAAFETLLHRHGQLVWRVCRRVLHREQDAEDAFQATFLALARQVKSIRKPESLTSFLHGTAYRIARRLQEDDHRRSAAREIPHAPVSDPSHEASWRELGRIVEEEVHALPEKLRTVLLLCYWEGLTNEEAARRLSCPCGTLKARLAKARERNNPDRSKSVGMRSRTGSGCSAIPQVYGVVSVQVKERYCENHRSRYHPHKFRTPSVIALYIYRIDVSGFPWTPHARMWVSTVNTCRPLSTSVNTQHVTSNHVMPQQYKTAQSGTKRQNAVKCGEK